LKPIPIRLETKSSPELETPNCGRICDDYMREARLIQSSLIPTAPVRDYGIEIACPNSGPNANPSLPPNPSITSSTASQPSPTASLPTTTSPP